MIDAALAIAATGVPVFPCGPDKAPRVAGGFKAATTDPDEIRRMPWSDDSMIGAVVLEGQIVIDIDPRNGGMQTIALLTSTHDPLPPTRTVKTKSGGWHRYYWVPKGVQYRSTLGPGVDVKQHGKGYVIVPPSAGYTYVTPGDTVDAPEWLLAELEIQERDTARHEASDPKFMERFEEGTAYGLAALQRQLGKLATAQAGERNNTLNAVTFSLAQLVAGGELAATATEKRLYDVAQLIGLEPEETEKTIRSAWAAGENEPWQAPEEQPKGSFGSPGGIQLSRPKVELPDEEHFWVDWEADEPELPFFAHPIIPKNAYVLVYGATEASKSMAMVGLMCEGSHRGFKSSVYSLENPPATDRQRIRRWGPNPANFRLTNNLLDVADERQVLALIERERAWATDMILIDTYSHAFTSRSDDGNAKAIAFAQVIRFIMQEVGCTVIVVDHTGFVGDEPRDASAKRQQVDVAILMKKAGEWRPGQPARFTMDNKKAARFSNPFFLTGEIRDGKDNALELGWIAEYPRWDT